MNPLYIKIETTAANYKFALGKALDLMYDRRTVHVYLTNASYRKHEKIVSLFAAYNVPLTITSNPSFDKSDLRMFDPLS